MEEKIDRLSSMMIEAVKEETPMEGINLMMNAFLNVVKNMGEALGYAPMELEYTILEQTCKQFSMKASREKRNK